MGYIKVDIGKEEWGWNEVEGRLKRRVHINSHFNEFKLDKARKTEVSKEKWKKKKKIDNSQFGRMELRMSRDHTGKKTNWWENLNMQGCTTRNHRNQKERNERNRIRKHIELIKILEPRTSGMYYK